MALAQVPAFPAPDPPSPRSSHHPGGRAPICSPKHPSVDGDSRGRWDGDTLVIDTTNFNDKTVNNTYNCCGTVGANLHVVERFRRVDADTIEFQYTVDDPTTWARPWMVAVPMTKLRFREYACHEGNYGIIGIPAELAPKEKTAEAAAKKGSK